MSQVSQKSPSNIRVWEYGKLLRLALAPIRRTKRRQWSVSDLKAHFHTANWTISYQALDLETGQALDGQCFLKPRSLEQVDDMLKTKKPWLDKYNAATDFQTRLDKELFVGDRFGDARDLWARITAYLEGSEEVTKPGILGTFSRWSRDLYEDYSLKYMGRNRKLFWLTLSRMTLLEKPSAKIERGSACTNPIDTSMPHTLAAIANMAPTVSEKISRAEIMALVLLAQQTVSDPKYDDHKLYHMSERDVRIIQGCFDVDSRKLDINVSPVLKFPTFLMSAKNRPKIFQLLGWFTSEPVGKTT